MAGTLAYFNNCVSKGDATAFIIELRNFMNELTHNMNNLVTRIEQIEQHPLFYRGDDEDVDADVDVFDNEDADADGDARNCCRYNFNCRGMGGNNYDNNDPFAKI